MLASWLSRQVGLVLKAFDVHAVPQAYDQHLNMILGEVEETLTTVEIDDETYEEIVKAWPLLPKLLLGCSVR